MDKVRRAGVLLVRKGSYYLAAKILLAAVLLVNAATIQSVVTSPSPQSIIGGALNVDSKLSGADKGFSKVGSAVSLAGASCASNVTYAASAQTATNGITAGHIIYDVQLNTTGTTTASTCFTVTLVITPSGGSQSTFNLFVATGSTVTASQTIDCKFDIGASLPSSPWSFRLTVP